MKCIPYIILLQCTLAFLSEADPQQHLLFVLLKCSIRQFAEDLHRQEGDFAHLEHRLG